MSTNGQERPQRKTLHDIQAFDFNHELSKATDLADLWMAQIEKRQNDSDRAYFKRHSLELTLGAKFFAVNQDDRSIVDNNAA